MKQLLTIITSFSIVISDNIHTKDVDVLFKYFQNKYQIYSLEDLKRKKIKTVSNNYQSNSNRDPSELVGDWELQNEEMGLYITVGTDQIAPTGGSISGFDPADGGIIVTHDDFTTELNYMNVGDFFGEDIGNIYRNVDALEHAQDYVDSAATLQGQSPFNLMEEFELTYFDSDSIVGGLGGDDPENCEINWPEDPYQMAVYSFVSEYVLNEGASVGCFTENMSLDQTYAYVALEIEEQWTGDDGGDDENGELQYMFMNFDIMNLFLVMFGMIPENVEHPTLLVVDAEDESVMAMVLDPEGAYVSLDIDSLILDYDNLIFTFNNLIMVDSSGNPALIAEGNLGPVMYELLAGEETEVPLPSMLIDSAFTDRELYLKLYDDGTGMDIEIVEEEDYYYGTYIDTNISYFVWDATDDSVFLTFLDDDGSIIEDENISLAYSIMEDTLEINQSIDPCTDPYYYYYYESYSECFENTDIGMYVIGVYDIQNFYQAMRSNFTSIDAVTISNENTIPIEHKLHSAYPNPFNPITTIRYDLQQGGLVNITIYDIQGRVVNNLVNSWQDVGQKFAKWNATNNTGQPLSAGVYFYTIEVGTFVQTKKMVLLK